MTEVNQFKKQVLTEGGITLVSKMAGVMLHKFLIAAIVSLQWFDVRGSFVSPTPSTEPPLVCPCEYRYEPVCGSDNVTYINKCVLDCINTVNPVRGYSIVKELHSGECSSLVCQKIDLPVCTLEGKTFPNECELAADNFRRIKSKQSIMHLAYRTACVGRPCGCTSVAAPVCGSDDVLYRNDCVLGCTSASSEKKRQYKITKKNNGACLDSCICPKTKDPICGSDGNQYNNLCEMQCANKFLKHSKDKQITVVDNSVCEACWCTADYDPVCGSDGKSYSNKCQLNCTAKRQSDSNLGIVSKGVCPLCYCSDVKSPVCGTDHITYRNECYLRCANSARTEFIGLHSNSACLSDTCDCGFCPTDYNPVCGNDGQTYENMCWLLCYADCLKTARRQGIWRDREGACFM